MKRFALLMWLVACSATADIVVDRTRILYPMPTREVSVTLTNRADSPRLVQAWIDAGNARLQPEYSDVPFSLTPPVLRVEPGKGQALRIRFHPTQGQGVAADRESVYWLNVLSIRPIREGDTGNNLHLAFRTRIKLFLRPEMLVPPGQPLVWRLLSRQPLLLEARNDSAYHVTLAQVTARAAGVEYRNDDPPMIAPKTTLTLALRGPFTPAGSPLVLWFSTLDDNGIARHHEQAL